MNGVSKAGLPPRLLDGKQNLVFDSASGTSRFRDRNSLPIDGEISTKGGNNARGAGGQIRVAASEFDAEPVIRTRTNSPTRPEESSTCTACR